MDLLAVVILIALLGFYLSKRLRDWFVTMPTTQDALKEVMKFYGPQALRMALSALLNVSREKAGDVVRGAPDAVAAGRRLFDEVRSWLSGKRDEPENDR